MLLALGLLAGCAPAPEPMQTVRDHYFYGGLAAFHEGLPAEAARQWQRAAELGDGEAARNLAHLYRQGLGVEADGHMAQAWYQVAADAGVISAEYNLGMLYMKGGAGLPADPDEGMRRLARAAEAGFPPATAELERLAAATPPSVPPAVAAESPPAPVPVAAEPAPAPATAGPVSAPATAGPVPAPATAEPVPVRMQIGSYRTRAAAEQDWKRLRLKGLSYEIIANRVGEQGRWYRLVAVGPAETIEGFCGSAQAKGMSCWSRTKGITGAK